MFQELKNEGSLNQYLSTLQETIGTQLDDLEESGLAHHEALEMVRDQMYPPSEEDLPDIGGTMQTYLD